MPASFVDSAFAAWIADGAGAALLAALKANLYTDANAVNRNVVLADLTPNIVDNTMWPGYAQATAIGLGSPVRGTDGKWQVRSDPILFSGSGTPPPSLLTVTTIALVDTAGTALVALGDLGEEGIGIQSDSQFIEVVVVIREDASITLEIETN